MDQIEDAILRHFKISIEKLLSKTESNSELEMVGDGEHAQDGQSLIVSL